MTKLDDSMLRITYELEKNNRLSWPRTFDDALALPIVRACLIALTRQRIERDAKQYANAKRTPLDWKRRAAGERDDD